MAEGLVKSARKIPTKFDNGFEPTFDSDGAPSCLSWKIDDVADWVEFLGFEQYRVRQKSSYLSFKIFFDRIQSVLKSHFENAFCVFYGLNCPILGFAFIHLLRKTKSLFVMCMLHLWFSLLCRKLSWLLLIQRSYKTSIPWTRAPSLTLPWCVTGESFLHQVPIFIPALQPTYHTVLRAHR